MKRFFITVVSSLLFASVVAGQALRINVIDSPRVTFLPIDIFCIIFTACAFLYLLVNKQIILFLRTVWSATVWRLLIIFVVWALISLVLNHDNYHLSSVLIAFSYWARLVLIFLTALFYYFFSKDKTLWRDTTSKIFLLFSVIILAFGYLQLIFLPDFSFMSVYGWDPHQDRMLSTFFDPNYFGTFIVLFMAAVLGAAFMGKQKIWNKIFIILFLTGWVALYFTYSRSAWLQGAIAIPIVAYKINWKLALGVLAVFIIIVFLPNRLGNRIAQSGSVFQSKDNSSQNSSNYDPSAAARGKSLIKGWNLARDNWLIGVGYNAYDAALIRSGASSENLNSSLAGRGSDSSLLNIFATTGLIGLSLFSLFLIILGLNLYRKGDFSLSAFLVAWVAGSFFNNSLLYVLILLPFLILASISLAQKDTIKIHDENITKN